MTEARALLGSFGDRIDESARAFLARGVGNETYKEMYDAMNYFMGYTDEHFAPTNKESVGKRFRSGLCLMLADWYGTKGAVPTALSLELFHNTTLIHDDVVDDDKFRRGRPTVLKLLGSEKAIHIGDGQLLLSVEALEEGGLNVDPRVRSFLLRKYREVFEGQYLDAILTGYALDDSRATEELYLEMLTKKTSVLVGASTRVAGMVAGVSAEEEEKLWQYGLSLGIAFQMYDDIASIWSSSKTTGKEAHGDIREKKKTLPVLYAVKNLSGAERDELVSLYSTSGPLDDTAIVRVIELLDSVNAYAYTRGLVDKHRDTALSVVKELSLSEDRKQTLSNLVAALLPETSSTK